MPSTSTLMLPSGSLRLCTMLTMVPTWKMSPALGSSIEASCWVARNIFLSLVRASSSARTLDSRPTTNGVIMYGKMTTSRMGIIGSFLLSNFSFAFDNSGLRLLPSGGPLIRVLRDSPGSSLLRRARPNRAPRRSRVYLTLARWTLARCLLDHRQRHAFLFHHLTRHFEFFHFFLARQAVHQLQHQFFQNHAQS